ARHPWPGVAREAARPLRSHPFPAVRYRGIRLGAATAPPFRWRSGRHRRKPPRGPTSRGASTCSRPRPCCHRPPVTGASVGVQRRPPSQMPSVSPYSINVDFPQPARVPGAAKHAFGTEFRDDPSTAVDCDDTTGPAQLTEPAMQQFTYRLLQPETAKLHHCTDVVRRDRANEILAMACRGDRADSILCIGPGSDDG